MLEAAKREAPISRITSPNKRDFEALTPEVFIVHPQFLSFSTTMSLAPEYSTPSKSGNCHGARSLSPDAIRARHSSVLLATARCKSRARFHCTDRPATLVSHRVSLRTPHLPCPKCPQNSSSSNDSHRSRELEIVAKQLRNFHN